MTREIKFRAWGKNSKEFLHDSQGYGLTLKEIQNIEDIDGWEFTQYTGLKDKNGKEIYEGDIVTVRLGGRLANQDGVWNEEEDIKGALVVEMKGLWWSIAPHWDEELEVIGNIYENPELLAVNQDNDK